MKMISVAVAIVSILLGGCAAGVPFDQGKGSIPPVEAGKGRIFVYRLGNPLTMMIPQTYTLDGKDAGTAFSGSTFYHDVMPGKHTVSYAGGERRAEIDVPMGGSVYLRYGIVGEADEKAGSNSVSLKSVAEVIPEATAWQELSGTTLVERYLLDLKPQVK